MLVGLPVLWIGAYIAWYFLAGRAMIRRRLQAPQWPENERLRHWYIVGLISLTTFTLVALILTIGFIVLT